MKFPILTDEELTIIYNRSNKRLSEFRNDIYAQKAKNTEESMKPIMIPNTGYASFPTLPKKKCETKLDIDNLDFNLYGSVIAFDEYLQYINENHFIED